MVRLLATAMWLFVSGCATVSQPPKPFANDSVRDSDQVAYLWNAGRVKQPTVSMQDFAVVTRIDDSVIPSEYRPGARGEPLRAWRMKIPAGTHTVEILNKETGLCIPGYFIIGPMTCVVVEKASRSVEFTAEPGRTYVPVVDQKCGKKWFWIADSGPALPAGSDTVYPLPFTDRVPAVGGETSPDGPCQSSSGDAAAREQ
jgi:hypothetical protein